MRQAAQGWSLLSLAGRTHVGRRNGAIEGGSTSSAEVGVGRVRRHALRRVDWLVDEPHAGHAAEVRRVRACGLLNISSGWAS